jgi:arylsulfate sulfotransferase
LCGSLCLFEEASQTPLTAVVSDLSGNMIWYYPIQPNAPFPMKLLPNGHMLVNDNNAVQEIDLAGTVLSQVSVADIRQGLTTAGFSFPTLFALHHDFVKLPNAHLILLVNYSQTFTDQPGVSTVLGDALIDWDPRSGPVWTWSTFDHIPLAHAPNGTADWTHANAVVYSPDEGNLSLSMRNQNWIIKINF